MENNTNVLGVIGGLGPLATARFIELVTQFTDADKEQNHLNMIVYSFPSAPDCSDFTMGYYLKSPLHRLVYVANELARQKVDLIAMPCMTAHYFYNDLSERICVPIIHAIEETAQYLKDYGISRAGIMASEGTISAELFHKALARHDIEAIVPSSQRQQDVTHLIYKNLKAGHPAQMDRFYGIANELHDNGAEVIVLGCAELSLIKREYCLGPGYLDSMEVLARKAVLSSGKALKQDKQSLIT